MAVDLGASGAASALVLLQAARRIAERHGGEARAAATESGTTLTLLLPTLLREM